MSEKKANQRIVEIATRFLDENELKNFLDFYQFLCCNKISKGKTGRTGIGSWTIKYKNKKIGHFKFHDRSWSIDCFDLFARNNWFEKCDKNITDELKEFILSNINTASDCCLKRTCHSVEDTVILGEMFNGRVCACRPIVLLNPDGKTLQYAKELVLIGKKIIAEVR